MGPSRLRAALLVFGHGTARMCMCKQDHPAGGAGIGVPVDRLPTLEVVGAVAFREVVPSQAVREGPKLAETARKCQFRPAHGPHLG